MYNERMHNSNASHTIYVVDSTANQNITTNSKNPVEVTSLSSQKSIINSMITLLKNTAGYLYSLSIKLNVCNTWVEI